MNMSLTSERCFWFSPIVLAMLDVVNIFPACQEQLTLGSPLNQPLRLCSISLEFLSRPLFFSGLSNNHLDYAPEPYDAIA